MENSIQGFRLSPHQRQIWLLQTGAGPFCAQCALELRGSLDPDRLRRAFEEVVARHEILRTTFRRAPGVKIPIQVVAENGSIDWRREGASDAAADGEEGLTALLEEERREPFDLEDGPLLRARLVGGDDRSLLLVTASALCADSRTLGHLVREAAQVYAGGSELEDPEELVQYVQFSEWQNELADEPEMAQAQEWGRRFTEIPEPWLAFETNRSSERDLPSDSLAFEVDPELAEGLSALAESSGVELGEVLLGAWQTLLWRLTGTTEVLTACCFAGRSYEELEGALGPFSKYLPVACRIDRRDTFTQVLERVGRAVGEGRQWQDYYHPEAEGDLRERGIYGVGFDFEVLPEALRSNGLSLAFLSRSALIHPLKLQLACSLDGSSLRAALSFDPRRFRREDVAGIAEQFRLLLSRILDDPQASVGGLDILTEREYRDLVVSFNDTARDLPESCLHELFARQVKATPDNVAVQIGDEELTYAELDRRSNRLAHRLRGLGVGPEVVVAVCMERSPELVAALLAVLKA
ncbi:MAG: AMP-binding protein, partial [Acidobacteria bacterium]|nr:AMP-binding protein [Acidobacteriota bacterium]